MAVIYYHKLRLVKISKGEQDHVNTYTVQYKLVADITFLFYHQLIGSSLLFIHDRKRAGIWMIDFEKTAPSESRLHHDRPWVRKINGGNDTSWPMQ
jgi:hypothetical protein